jgi:DNA-binding transcriptional LysR family regulator
MNLRQIEVFRAVMTTGSITGAARLLHVSQPGVSRLIRHLELQLGLALFERHNGRLAATPEAHALHTEVDKVYRGVRHVQEVAVRLKTGNHATLRVLSSANTALQLVPRSIASLLQRLPQSKVLFEAVPTREIIKLLVAEEADVAISSAPLDHPALEVMAIGHWELLCAMRSGHWAIGTPVLDLERILRERLILYSHEAPQSRIIDEWLERFAIHRDVSVEVRSGYAACALAATGAGVAFVDNLSARMFRDSELVLLPIPDAPRFSIYIVRNANRPVSMLGQTFIDIVIDELKTIDGAQMKSDSSPQG